MEIDWTSFVAGTLPLLAALILRLFIDMLIWPPMIKVLSKIPTRGLFRADPPNLRGEWDVYWESSSDTFADEKDRHKTAVIYQFHDFCYADYAAKDRRYCMTGKIEGQHLTGTWYDKNDRHGYRGAFQLRIVDSKRLSGRWLGFSQTELKINTDTYTWTQNPT